MRNRSWAQSFSVNSSETPVVVLTVRDIINRIFTFIGVENITDDEFETVDLELDSLPTLVYETLLGILVSRDAVSNKLERLRFYFLAKNVQLEELPSEFDDENSHILIGRTMDASPESGDLEESNSFIGGAL